MISDNHGERTAAALRLLNEAQAAKVAMSLQSLGTSVIACSVYAQFYPSHDASAFLRRATNTRWSVADQGHFDASGAWAPKIIAFLDGEIAGVPIAWNGTPEQAERLREAMSLEEETTHA